MSVTENTTTAWTAKRADLQALVDAATLCGVTTVRPAGGPEVEVAFVASVISGVGGSARDVSFPYFTTGVAGDES